MTMRTLLRSYLLLVAFLRLLPVSQAWILERASSALSVHRRLFSSSSLCSSRSSDNDGNNSDAEEDDRQKKMQLVRTVQDIFYSNNNTRSELDPATGIIYNLPLWRVPWQELPFRSNVLNVHEAHYTNMFEAVIHADHPLYVGHLYLEGGSTNLNSDHTAAHSLKSWDEQIGDNDDNDKRSAVLGTLLRISDYRRMSDGRLLLLVQALERFVVKDVQQELPYSMANVQLLPDTEEVEESDWIVQRIEGDCTDARALALQESFQRWHRYEFENTMLPLPLQADLRADEVVGSALAKVLPYSSYSRVVDVESLAKESLDLPRTASSSSEPAVPAATADYSKKTLEYRLLQGGILKQPTQLGLLKNMTADHLEFRIWLALDDFLRQTRIPVSPVLFGLMPVDRKWPAKFVLEKIGDAIAQQTDLEHKYVRVSPAYPAARRQKRLSYAVTVLLEEVDTVNAFRQELLEVPSTKERLALVLQKLENKIGFQ